MRCPGLFNSFGVFQTYYRSSLIHSSSNSEISWIGSLEGALLACTPIFAGPLFDVGHARLLVLGGSILVVLGLMMTSLCTTYWQRILAQGVCTGIGSGALFLVTVAILPFYFSGKRAVAVGIAASGSPVAGIVYTIAFHYLQTKIGFGCATRIIGFIALAGLVLAFACLRPVPPLGKRRKIIDLSGFRELSFNLFAAAVFFGNVGLYLPFFYLTTYAKEAGFSDELAFYMLPILNGGSVVGRVIPSLLADRVGPIAVITLCTAAAGILGFCWIAAGSSVPGLVIWSFLYGVFSGAFLSLQNVCVARITKDMGVLGGRIGTNNFFVAAGVLVGTPIGGAILGNSRDWVGLQAFCGGSLVLASLSAFATRWAAVGISFRVKA
jgi:MFS family permease